MFVFRSQIAELFYYTNDSRDKALGSIDVKNADSIKVHILNVKFYLLL